MERIIKGQKRYNTDTAKEKGSYQNGAKNSPDWYCETLYRKKSGEFFLHGVGNSQSKYSEGGRKGMEDIIPLTYDQAQAWAKKHLPKEQYDECFGEIKKTGKYPCHLMLPSATAEKLRRVASKAGKQQAEIVAELIERYL